MPVRKVYGNTPDDINQLARDINDELAQLRALKMDLSGRTITNSGVAKQPSDLVTKGQLDRLSGQVAALANKKVAVRTRATTTPSGTTLPPPTHPISYGYWLADRPADGDNTYGDFYDEVKGYTNTYHFFGQFGYGASGTPLSVWQNRAAASLARAANDGKSIHMLFDEGSAYPECNPADCFRCVEIAGVNLVWPKVVSLCIGHEINGLTKSQAEARANNTINFLRNKNVPMPPNGLGLILSGNALFNTDVAQANGISWIAIECYIDAPGDPVSANNVAKINADIAKAMNAIPASKKASFIMQGYARNHPQGSGTGLNWSNLETLQDIQIPVYLAAHDNDRVFEVAIFSYGRQTGTRDIDRNFGGHMADRHKLIGAAILGGTVQTDGCHKDTSGPILGDIWADVIQFCIADHGDLVESINNVVFVRSGSESAFVDALIDEWNESGLGVEAAHHPEGSELIVCRHLNSNTFSETFNVYASDRRLRVTSFAYIEICRPAMDVF